MTPADDLRVGMLVAVSAYYGPEVATSGLPQDYRGREPEFDGKPWEVRAISFPFVCLSDGSRRCSVDIRVWGLQKVTRQYSAAYYLKERNETEIKLGRRRRRKEKPSKFLCPRCGGNLKKTLKTKDRIWIVGCTDCDWRDEPPKSEVLR